MVAWAAGFYEGEGSVKISRPRGGAYLRLSIPQRTREPLDRMKEIFGGCVYLKRDKARTNDCYVWELTGRKAVAAAKEMLPLLSVRRRGQIETMLNSEGW